MTIPFLLGERTAELGGPRFMPVDSDSMAPTLRIGDLVAVSPIDGFAYDSIYVLEVCGRPCLYRCQSMGDGAIRVASDNPAYAEQLIPRATFDARVIGIVAATCRVLDHSRVGIA